MTTKYTKAQRRAIAAAFRQARLFIEGGVRFFICHALDLVASGNPQGAVLAKYIVHSRMQPPKGPSSGYSLENWLVDNGHATYRQLSRVAMREYRVRWLTALIEEFES